MSLSVHIDTAEDQVHADIDSWMEAKKALAKAAQQVDEMCDVAIQAPFPLLVRPATPKDIREGNIIWYRNEYPGGSEPFWALIEEVRDPTDPWKAYTSHDGCRYGLDDAYVELES